MKFFLFLLFGLAADAQTCDVREQISMGCFNSADCSAEANCMDYGSYCGPSQAMLEECHPSSGDLARDACNDVANCEWNEGGSGDDSGGGGAECRPSDFYLKCMTYNSSECAGDADCLASEMGGLQRCSPAGSISMECAGGLSGGITRDGCDALSNCQWDEGHGGGDDASSGDGGGDDASSGDGGCDVREQISMGCFLSADCSAEANCMDYTGTCGASPAMVEECHPSSGDLARDACDDVANCEWNEGGSGGGGAECRPSDFYLKCMTYDSSECAGDADCMAFDMGGQQMCSPAGSISMECRGGLDGGITRDGCDALSKCQWDEGDGGGDDDSSGDGDGDDASSGDGGGDDDSSGEGGGATGQDDMTDAPENDMTDAPENEMTEASSTYKVSGTMNLEYSVALTDSQIDTEEANIETTLTNLFGTQTVVTADMKSVALRRLLGVVYDASFSVSGVSEEAAQTVTIEELRTGVSDGSSQNVTVTVDPFVRETETEPPSASPTISDDTSSVKSASLLTLTTGFVAVVIMGYIM